jgi:hypothetical protein
MSGSVVPVGVGLASVVRIPVPNSGGLHLELKPPPTYDKTSTSTVFIHSADGKKELRLDYGYNKRTHTWDYHWNKEGGVYKTFGIQNHTPTGPGGKVGYHAARVFKWGGRALLVAGAVQDLYAIVQAEDRVREIARVAGCWGGGAIGAKAVGAGGAAVGTFVEPGGGTMVGGFVGGVLGGIGGCALGAWGAVKVHDYVKETLFTPLPEVSL